MAHFVERNNLSQQRLCGIKRRIVEYADSNPE